MESSGGEEHIRMPDCAASMYTSVYFSIGRHLVVVLVVERRHYDTQESTSSGPSNLHKTLRINFVNYNNSKGFVTTSTCTFTCTP